HLPDEQAAPRLEPADVAGDADVMAGQRVVRRRHRPGVAQVPPRPLNQVVVVQDQLAGRPVPLPAGAGPGTSPEARLDVAVVLHGLDGLVEAQARLVVDVPLATRLVAFLGGQQGRVPGQVEERVVAPGGSGLFEGRRLLAVGVAAAAVIANLAG